MPRRSRSQIMAALLAALFAAVPAYAFPSQFQFDVIAHSGGPAPAVPGAVIQYFADWPALGGNGQVSFAAAMQIGPGGVTAANEEAWWVLDRNLAVIRMLREGDALPGAPTGVAFDPFALKAPAVSFSGEPGIVARFNAGAGEAILGPHLAGQLGTIALEGYPLAGAPAGFDTEPVASAPEVFLGDLDRAALPVRIGDVDTLWLTDALGGVQLVAESGQHAPGTPTGTAFESFWGARVNPSGEVAFWANLTGSDVNADNEEGIWLRGSDSQLALVARSGDSAAGLPQGTTYALWAGHVLAGSGKIALVATLEPDPVHPGGSNSILTTDATGQVAPFLLAGDQAPGAPAGARFLWLWQTRINASGQLAFRGYLVQDGQAVHDGNDEGIWGPDGTGGVTLRVREGDAVPGTTPTAAFEELGEPSLNDRGEIVFHAHADDGTPGGRDLLCFISAQGVVEPAIASGDLLDVAPGDVREIEQLDGDVLPTAQPSGKRAFNNLGEFSFSARFSDGTSAIVRGRILRPRACGLGVELVLLAVPLGAVRRRVRGGSMTP